MMTVSTDNVTALQNENSFETRRSADSLCRLSAVDPQERLRGDYTEDAQHQKRY